MLGRLLRLCIDKKGAVASALIANLVFALFAQMRPPKKGSCSAKAVT